MHEYLIREHLQRRLAEAEHERLLAPLRRARRVRALCRLAALRPRLTGRPVDIDPRCCAASLPGGTP